MLQKIRDNTQGIVSKIFVYFIIGIFSLWGIEAIVGTLFTSTNQLEVNGTEISEAEIETLTQRKSQEFFSSLGEDADLSTFDENQFRESAISELIQRELLNQSAEKSGMGISSATIDRNIAMTPDFQIDGVFNAERASLLLQSMGYSPAGYRALLASETLLNQLLTTYSSTGFATSVDLARVVALSHQKRSFRYLTIPMNIQMDESSISDAEISEYYSANEADFMQEERVKLEYLQLSKESLMDEITVTEPEIRAAYDAEVAAYQAQTERRASHILFAASTETEFTAAMEKATEVKARIDAGEDFGTLAGEFSDDTGSAPDGGDVGFTTGTNFVENFETALRELSLNDVSEPVRTEFGVHLIKLTALSETEIDSYEFRRDALERDLKSAGVDSLYLARSEELSNLAFESFDLDDPAEQMGLTKQETQWFGRSGGAGITGNAGLIAAAFSPEVIDEGLNSALIQLEPGNSVVVHLKEHQLSELRPLEAVRSEIQVLLQIEKMQEQVRTQGEAFVTSLQNGDNIDSLLELQNLSWESVTDVERTITSINPEITNPVFSAPRPEAGQTVVDGIQLSSGDYVVFELQSVTDGTAADFKEGEEQNMRNFISQQQAANDFAGYLESLEARAEIKGKTSYLSDFDEEF